MELIGIRLNKKKTKIFLGKNVRNEWMKNFTVYNHFNTEILGYFFGNKNFLRQKRNEMKNNLLELWKKLRFINNKQIHYYYLKNCALFGKINHYLRSIEIDSDIELLEKIDELALNEIELLIESKLNKDQIMQLRGPLNYGGMGFRSFKTFSEISYSKSLHKFDGVIKVVEFFNQKQKKQLLKLWDRKVKKTNQFWVNKFKIKEKIISNTDDKILIKCLENKNLNYLGKSNLSKKLWKKVDQIRHEFLKNNLSKKDMVRYISMEKSKCNIWTTIIPKGKNKMTNSEFKYAFIFSLRGEINKNSLKVKSNMKICDDIINKKIIKESDKIHNCKKCLKEMDSYGLHPIKCNRNGDITRRHNEIIKILTKYMKKAGWTFIIEKKNIIGDSGERPADIFINRDLDGNTEIALDITVPTAYTKLFLLNKEKIKSGMRAEFAEKNKLSKYKRLIDLGEIIFKPLVVETCGKMNKNMDEIISRLARNISEKYNEWYSQVISEIRNSIYMSLLKSNYFMTISRIS